MERCRDPTYRTNAWRRRRRFRQRAQLQAHSNTNTSAQPKDKKVLLHIVDLAGS